MCTVTAKRRNAQHRSTGRVLRRPVQSVWSVEDEIDNALFISSLTPDCFVKADQKESVDFENWLFAK